jgi:uncharacterized protein
MQEFQDATIALERGDYTTAMRIFRLLADRGNADAQNNLGVMYYTGQGVPQDKAAAMSWFRKAADQGHAVAQNKLGIAYGSGDDVPQDYAEKLRWH